MSVRWEHSEFSARQPPREEEVAQFEREIGYELPADYRAHLLMINGGSPVPDGYWIRRSGSEPEAVSLRGFLPFVNEPYNPNASDLTLQARLFNSQNVALDCRFPAWLLPIGQTGCDGDIVINLWPTHLGHIYLTHNDYGLGFELSNLYRRKNRARADSIADPQLLRYVEAYAQIADSFQSFVDGLTEIDKDAI